MAIEDIEGLTMDPEEIKDVMTECVTKRRGCRVTKKDGKVLDLTSNSCNFFNVKNGFSGETPDGIFHTVMLVDVQNMETV